MGRPLRNPGETVWPGPSGDPPGHGPGLEVDHRHVVVAVDRDERLRVVGNQDSLRLLAEREALRFLAGRRVDDDEIAGLEIGHERKLAVRRELDPVRPLGAERDRMRDFPGRDVDDRYTAVA